MASSDAYVTVYIKTRLRLWDAIKLRIAGKDFRRVLIREIMKNSPTLDLRA